MAKAFIPQVVTANDLVEGDSVFLGADGWVRDIRTALVAHTAEEAGLLEADGMVGEKDNLVVGPYLVEVSLESGAPWPVLRREQIRAERAPTIPVGIDAIESAREAA